MAFDHEDFDDLVPEVPQGYDNYIWTCDVNRRLGSSVCGSDDINDPERRAAGTNPVDAVSPEYRLWWPADTIGCTIDDVYYSYHESYSTKMIYQITNAGYHCPGTEEGLTLYDNREWNWMFEYIVCDDEDIPFSEKDPNFQYSDSWRGDTINAGLYFQDCEDNFGKTEYAYINCVDMYRCKYRPGWKYDEGCGCFVPEEPGIPEGPSLPPPEWIEPVDPDNPTCPECYTWDPVKELCIYTGGEGCEPIPCTETAGCDIDTPITGVCEGRDDCI